MIPEKKKILKKIIFTLADIIVVMILGLWVFWLCIYFAQSFNGAILVEGDANIFERNYLVPAQIFGITIIMTIVTIINYIKLRKKKLIGRPYIILVMYNTIPFWLMSIMQIDSMIFNIKYIH